MSDQPDWLQEVISGLAGGRRYRVVHEGKKYAIIVCPGRTVYLSRGSGSVYSPTTCYFVEKGANFWHGTFVKIHEGRVTNAVKARLAEILAKGEKGKVPKGDRF
jgi:hypothetical protein